MSDEVTGTPILAIAGAEARDRIERWMSDPTKCLPDERKHLEALGFVAKEPDLITRLRTSDFAVPGGLLSQAADRIQDMQDTITALVSAIGPHPTQWDWPAILIATRQARSTLERGMPG